MNQVTIHRKSPFSAPEPDPVSSDALAVAQNSAVRDYPAAPEVLLVPMKPDARRRLELRKLALEQSLAPCAKADHPQIAKIIAGMLGAFGGHPGGNPEATVAKYLHVLADLPAWSIVAACSALERGDVDGASLDFRPSAPRVRDTARELCAPWLEEYHHVRRVLDMPALEPEDEETRLRVGKLFSELADKLKHRG
jgi:hypothetical protein